MEASNTLKGKNPFPILSCFTPSYPYNTDTESIKR